eukprot:8835181-Prorocentrum_lima.AAC.1
MVEELQIAEKEGKVAVAVLAQIQKTGMSSKEVVEMYERQVAFCQRPPTIESPFPKYLQEIMHCSAVAETWPAKDFWDLVGDKVLSSFYKADVVGQKQIEHAA